MASNVTRSSSTTPRFPLQEAPIPPTNGRTFSYMPPWANMPKIPHAIPVSTSTIASLSSRISTSSNPKELTTQNYPQYWQKELAPVFEKLFPKVFAEHNDVQSTLQNLLSEDPVKKSSGALVLVDYLSAPPIQGLKNEKAVFYFLDSLQLTIALSQKELSQNYSNIFPRC